jgi:paraquat-inducible protein B
VASGHVAGGENAMADTAARRPELASLRRSRRLPVIWAVPIVAIAIGAWLAWDTLSKQGPRIVVSFQDAEGLQIGQSQLKFKDIALGTVQGLEFTPDHRRVLVTIATTRQAEPMLTAGTQFWVVKPRLFAGNLSGFSTLLSGAYVGMVPGDSNARPAREFVGREEPPVLESDVPGRTFLLKSSQLGSLNLGSPVFYRGLLVGQVLGWDIGDMAESVTIHAFVRSPFDSYVHDETRFWNASGVSVKLGAGGVDMQVESLRALLLGGIAFDTPTGKNASKTSAADRVFPLFLNQDAAKSASYSRKISLVTYFTDSVRGLTAGSDVAIHGLKVGQVTDVRLTYDAAKDKVLAPVRFEVEPERVIGVGHQVFDNPEQGLAELLRHGLRATLQSGNLLTGEMYIGLEFVPDASGADVTKENGAFVVPSAESGGLSGLQSAANELLRNVNAIPFASIGQNLEAMTKGMNEITNGPQAKEALDSLAATMRDAQQAVRQLDSNLTPALKRLPDITNSLQGTLKQSSEMLRSLDGAYGDNSQFHRDLNRLLAQLNDAVRSLRSLADLLTRHPEALVRGRPGGGTE